MLEAKNITKTFQSEGVETLALREVSLTLQAGEFVSIVGRSGSGKTTFLNVLSTLLAPNSGQILYQGEDVTGFSAQRLNELRNRDFAVVFQFHYLLPYLTARENVLLPFMNGIGAVGREEIHACRASAWSGSASAERGTSCPAICPAANSSGWPSPGPWSRNQRFSLPTSLRAIWTRARASRSWTCWRAEGRGAGHHHGHP